MPPSTASRILFCLVLTCAALKVEPSLASSATWLPSPSNGNWNDSANWTPGGPPNGAADKATFVTSTTTELTLSANSTVNEIIFSANASAYTITATSALQLVISDVGITNNSGAVQNFAASVTGPGSTPTVQLLNATAGSNMIYTANGTVVINRPGGLIDLRGVSNAENSTFIANPAAVNGGGSGEIILREGATANHAAFTAYGASVFGAFGGEISLIGAIADHATFVANGGAHSSGDSRDGGKVYLNSTSAGNASFTNNGGVVDGAHGGEISFSADCTAAFAEFTNNPGSVEGAGGGTIYFRSNSTADHGTFNNKGTSVNGALGGTIIFSESSNAGSGVFTNGAVIFESLEGGATEFHDTSSAMNGTFTTGSGGRTEFFELATAANAVLDTDGNPSAGLTAFRGSSTADNATLIGRANYGWIVFDDLFTGGTCRVEVFGNGLLDISRHDSPGVTIGSLEGDGNVFLGNNALQVGSNGASTNFSGSIQNGGIGGGSSGSLVKIGSGTLSLSGSNSYVAGTAISQGTLQASHDGALGRWTVNVTANGVLTLQNGVNNDYIADTAALSIVTGSLVNLNFTGNADTINALLIDGVAQVPGFYGSSASGAQHPLSQFTGTEKILVQGPTIVSRKTQGTNAFDLYLPPYGYADPAIECRSGGPTNQYQFVVTFLNPVTVEDALVRDGNGTINGVSGSGTNVVTINLSNVTNAQTIDVTLSGPNLLLDIPMRILVGDINANGVVNSSDVSQTKAESGHPLTNANFRADVTANGSITGTDVSFVKSRVGTALP